VVSKAVLNALRGCELSFPLRKPYNSINIINWKINTKNYNPQVLSALPGFRMACECKDSSSSPLHMHAGSFDLGFLGLALLFFPEDFRSAAQLAGFKFLRDLPGGLSDLSNFFSQPVSLTGYMYVKKKLPGPCSLRIQQLQVFSN
jgi:hypothetical protein